MDSSSASQKSRRLLAAAIAAAAAGCGDFTESTADAPQVTIDAGGGALDLHALHFVIPRGALDHAVTVRAYATGEAGAVGEAFRIEPGELTFKLDATATVSYDPATYPHATDMFVARREGGHWVRLMPANQKAGHASGPTPAAGIFGLLHCPAGVCPI